MSGPRSSLAPTGLALAAAGGGLLLFPIHRGLALVVVASGGAIAGIHFAWSRPRHALTAAVPLLLLAATKFRARSTSDTLAGVIDAQIWFELCVYGLAGIFCLRSLSLWKATLRQHRGALFLAAFVGLAITSALWSPIPRYSFVRATQYAIILTAAVTTVHVFGAKGAIDRLGWSCALYVAAFASIRLVMPGLAALPMFTTFGGIDRFTWFAVHPGIAAFIAGIGLIFLFSRLLSAGDRPWSWTALAAIGALGLAAVVLMTRSRTEMLALATVLPAMVLRRTMTHGLFAAAVFLLVTIGTGLLLVLGPVLDTTLLARADHTALTRFLMRGQTVSEFSGLSGRIGLWRDMLPLIADRLLTGWGYLASRLVLMERVPWASYAHNGPLQNLMDLGLIGAAMLWFAMGRAMLVSTAAVDRRASRTALTTFSLLLFLVLESVTGDGIGAAPGPQIIVLAFSVAAADRLSHSSSARRYPHDPEGK